MSMANGGELRYYSDRLKLKAESPLLRARGSCGNPVRLRKDDGHP